MKRFVFKIFLFLTTFTFEYFHSTLTAQNIKEFFIECEPQDFEYLYANYQQDIYIPIVLIYNGITWSDVKMRIRGDTSREFPKKSLKVTFNSDPFLNGRKELNFNADYLDVSYLHSFLSTLAFKEAGLDCVEVEHIRLYLNDQFLGLYLLTENLDEEFLFQNNFDTTGNLYKAAIDGASLSIYDNVYYHWEKKSGNQPYRDDLSQLIFNINNCPDIEYYDFLQSNFNYNRTISFIAINMLLSNGSTYYHNYFLYKYPQPSGKWEIFPWDMDRTFSDYTIWFPYHSSSGWWTPNNPLLERSIIVPNVFNDIKEKIEAFKNSFFNPTFLYPIIDSLKNELYTSVLNDTTDNILSMETWYNKIDTDKEFISQRFDNLDYQFNNWPSNFKINRHLGYFPPGELITCSWYPSLDPNGSIITYKLYYSKDPSFEDNTTVIIPNIADTFYTINSMLNEGKYYWKVKATDNSATLEGFDSYNNLYISEFIPNVMINEINYNSNDSFNAEDWLEIYNAEDVLADLSGWYFKDEDDQHVYYFPTDLKIDPKSYIILCRDTSLFFSVYSFAINVCGNFNFGLSSKGELLRLFHSSGYLVDSLVYRNSFPWPSGPNGTGSTLELLNPNLDNALGYSWGNSIGNGTPGYQNSVYSPDYINEFDKDHYRKYSIYPNPFNSSVDIEFELNVPASINVKVLNQLGQVLVDRNFETKVTGKNKIAINTNELDQGVYYFYFFRNNQFLEAKSGIKLNP